MDECAAHEVRLFVIRVYSTLSSQTRWQGEERTSADWLQLIRAFVCLKCVWLMYHIRRVYADWVRVERCECLLMNQAIDLASDECDDRYVK